MSDTAFGGHLAASHRLRKFGLLSLAALAAVGGLTWLAQWYLHRDQSISTDNAYVAGDLVQVTSDVAGTATVLHVDDTQSVESGQVLVELDSTDARLALAAAEADLASVVRQVRGLFAQVEQLQAQIDERDTALKRAEADFGRRQALSAKGAVSKEELSHSQDAVLQTRAALVVMQEQYKAALVQVQYTTVATHPRVMLAEAAVRSAALSVQRTRITAPIAGVIAKRSVQIGQRIAAGTPLMTIVPLTQVWVDANFREVQLARLRIGQPVSVYADIYGDKVEYRGKVAGLSAGSGSAFALLPAQNASGNWIKIVQRVPVRIALDRAELQAHPLRLGLSMTARVDVRDISGPLVATQARAATLHMEIDVAGDAQTTQRIAEIVANNSGISGEHVRLPRQLAAAAVPCPLVGDAGVHDNRTIAARLP